MILQEITIEGYKCFKNKITIPIHSLTVLIGENDSGKSTAIKGIELLLGKINPNLDDYFNLNGEIIDRFTITGSFIVDLSTAADPLKPYVVENRFYLKKVFVKGQNFTSFSTKVLLVDVDLENYMSLGAEQTKALLQKYGMASKSNQDERRTLISEYIKTNFEILTKKTDEVTISNFTSIHPYLPIFQYFGSHEYGNPQSLVKKTLDTIVVKHFYDEAGELKIKSIRKLREKILNKLNDSIEDALLGKIQKYNSNVVNIQGKLDLDFAKGLGFNGLELDEGLGFKLIDQKGEGSKKRLFLAILEWDKDIQTSSLGGRPVIRAYDEPDSNLHFEAQRKMFSAISAVANNLSANTQAIVATHSLTMIDRAPANCINRISQKDGVSNVSFLSTGGDSDIQTFLNEIGVIGGIKNSSIFYERCFLIVEGESEEASIGKIYKKWYGKTLAEDGVVLVNLQSNGSWYNFLKLLRNNKKESTVMLLDTDTQNANSGASVTVDRLNELGFDQSFLSDNVFFAGIQEFEDLYPNNRIRDVFNNFYPRSATGKWTTKHIQQIRISNLKISKGFKAESSKFITYHKRWYKKPEFASAMVDVMSEREIKSIPVLQNLFNRIQQIIA
jgi:energy-coupling factor transporter ATP-binding protein EcfA2